MSVSVTGLLSNKAHIKHRLCSATHLPQRSAQPAASAEWPAQALPLEQTT
jgi:hypothetical protein